jgi:hypothetical protein
MASLGDPPHPSFDLFENHSGEDVSLFFSRANQPEAAHVAVLALNVMKRGGCGEPGCRNTAKNDAIGCFNRAHESLMGGADADPLNGLVIGHFEDARRMMIVLLPGTLSYALLRAAITRVSPSFASAEAAGAARILLLMPLIGLVADGDGSPAVLQPVLTDMGRNRNLDTGLFGTAEGGGLRRAFVERHVAAAEQHAAPGAA